MSTLKTTILLSALACLAMSSAAFAQDNVPVKAPESLKNVPFKIEGVEGFLHSPQEPSFSIMSAICVAKSTKERTWVL